MATATKKLHKESIANAYRETMKGRISDAKIEENVKKLTADDLTSYAAVGNIAGMVIYDKLQCTISATGEQFNGHAWGIGTPGGGFLTGDVWTSDLTGLLANTTSVKLIAIPGALYTSFIFYDDNGNGLGSFQALSVSTVVGTGSGPGSWS